MFRLRTVLLIVLAVAAAAAAVTFAKSANARDVQRVSDIREIQRQLVLPGTVIPAQLAANTPQPVDSKRPYQYRATGQSFVACTTFERQDSRNAFFVTATGEFRAERKYCEEPVDPRVAQIVTDARLTGEAIPVFLGAAPELANGAMIKEKCQIGDKGESLYGCYLPDRKIWILEVTDPELAGLSTVAAVHELLHALEATDPPPAAQLDAEAARLNDPVLTDELALYEPSERTAELGARLGTEHAGLNQELEAYYSKYFDRAALLARYQAYGALVREVTLLEAQLESQKRELDSLRDADRTDEYNAKVEPYNAIVRRYNALAERYNLVAR